jgi:hypothetical protein
MSKLVPAVQLARFSCVLAALGLAPIAGASEFVGLDSSTSQLYSFDDSAAPATLLGVVSGTPQFGFGRMDRSQQGTLYVAAPGPIGGYSIMTIDESSLNASTIATVPTNSSGAIGFAIDPTGTKAFTFGYVGLSLKLKLQEVDLATGTMTERGEWVASVNGLAFDATGQLYTVAAVSSTQVRLFRVNQLNAALSVPVGSAFSGIDMSNGIDLASDRGGGFVYAYTRADSKLHALDTTVGGLVSSTPVNGVLLSSIAADVSCQGAIVPYGSGCAGSGGFVPQLVIEGCASVGGQLDFAITQGLGGSTAILFLGLLPSSIPVGAGCTFYLGGLLPFSLALPLTAGGPGAGSVAFSASLPSGVNGLVFTTQAWVIDPAVSIGGAGTGGVQVAVAP